MTKNNKGRAIVNRAAFLFVFTLCSFGFGAALFHPESPVPNEWHPLRPLLVSDPATLLTSWKLRRTLDDPAQCLTALEQAAEFSALEDKSESENCGISPRLILSTIDLSTLGELETSCATALTTAMWERHSVQPRAVEILGERIARIRHAGSYSCRRIRSSSGSSNRWSTHARARAIDVVGFDLIGGRQIRLLDDWNGGGKAAQFLRSVRDDGCKWFGLTLSPDYNALHADHFHLQVDGWGSCR